MEDVREECTMQNIVTEIETMFCDEEYGFEVYALIKGDEKTLKRFAFYEKNKNNQDNFKDKIQKTIAEVVKRDYGVEASQYVSVDYVADDQHRIYVLPQNEQYAPFEYLKAVEPKENYFGVNDFDNVDAILFRFKRESRCIWAYQSVQPILIPNKKKENFLVKAISTEDMDKFEEFTDRIFTITQKVYLLVVGENILTRDIKLMQRHFGFEQYIRSEAMKVVEDITKTGLVENNFKLQEYVSRPSKTYAKKMLRIKQYNVVKLKSKELIKKIQKTERWRETFTIINGKIQLNTYKDVEHLIDLFDERYTKSLITNDEFDTDVKRIAKKNET